MADEAERDDLAPDPEELQSIRGLFTNLYSSLSLSDCVELSIEGTTQLDIDRSGFTYGETGLQALLHMLRAANLPSYCCMCERQPIIATRRCQHCGHRPAGPAIVDLGSGIGNLVVGAALLTAAKLVRASSVRGVELLLPLHEAAESVVADLKSRVASGAAVLPGPLPPCRVERGDLTTHDVSDTDVVYLCSTVFPNETLAAWSEHAAKTMRIGSRVITPAFPLSHTCFEVERTMKADCSWGTETFYVHTIVRNDSSSRKNGGGAAVDAHRPTMRSQLERDKAAGLVITWDSEGRSGWQFVGLEPTPLADLRALQRELAAARSWSPVAVKLEADEALDALCAKAGKVHNDIEADLRAAEEAQARGERC